MERAQTLMGRFVVEQAAYQRATDHQKEEFSRFYNYRYSVEIVSCRDSQQCLRKNQATRPFRASRFQVNWGWRLVSVIFEETTP